MFSCGLNDYYQTGIFNEYRNIEKPTKVNFFNNIKIKEIYGTCAHTAVTTRDGYF
jgi:hypothetical protein